MPSRTSFIYHPDALLHNTGPGHPERRERLETMVAHLMTTDLWQKLDHARPEEAKIDDLTLAHAKHYVEWVQKSIAEGETLLDEGDTRVCRESWRAALLGVGSVLQGVEVACGKEKRNVFCAVRPPGHHAMTSRAMGFCLFNNIAIGARTAQKKHGVERVAIVDWDVHHGNGTQEIFWHDPTVLYVSLHQYPLWPGTGSASEVGEGPGTGFTVNCPMAPGSGEKEYSAAFRDTIIPALKKFGPQLLMISAGFDAHKSDPLANINLDSTTFAMLTRMLRDAVATSTTCGVVSVLEGGYDMHALAESVEQHVSQLIV